MSRFRWQIFRMRSRTNLKGFHGKRPLENRTILCADCDCNRILDASSGSLVCASCGSKNWMFVTIPIIAKFRGYSEREAQERAEEFFASRDALL